MRLISTLCAVVLLVAAPAHAQNNDKDDKSPAREVGEPKRFVSERSGRFNGQTVRYTVTAGETHLKNRREEPIASVFSIAYTRDGVTDPTGRPVTFVFNGGPGSASLWLHMGVFGPRRIDVPSEAENAGAPPYDIVDNALSILDVTDLVFIDPVGTGYSRAVGSGKAKDFYGVREDARSLAQFVRRWITENKRWNSPKYIAGESYGTTRAAALTDELTRGFNGIYVNGLVLISAILDFTGARYQPGNEMPYLSFLPTFAATAWYHDRLPDRPESLEVLLDEVRRFTLEDYAPALLKGHRLTEPERVAVVDKLARYTGLDRGYIERTELRINNRRFMKELLRDQGLVVGRFDSRYTGRDYDDAGEFFDDDPSGYGITGAYVASVNHYLTGELGVDFTREYRVLTREPGRHWNWSIDRNRRWPSFVNVAPWIGTAMRENKDMRVMVASGYYDLATPFFASENTMNTNGIPTERVIMTYYEAGHMMYVHGPSLDKFTRDVRAFIAAEPAS